MADNNNVNVKFSGDASALDRTMTRTQKRFQSWASNIERMAQGPRSMMYAMMKDNPITAVAISVGLLGTAIMGAALKFSAFLDSIKKQADALEITTDAYQKFQHAANRSGVSMDNVSNYITRFSTRLQEAKERKPSCH